MEIPFGISKGVRVYIEAGPGDKREVNRHRAVLQTPSLPWQELQSI